MIIFDADGTIRDLTHRLHHIQKRPKNWDQFYKDCALDTPIHHMIGNLKMFKNRGENVMIWSGCSDVAREITYEWLANEDIIVEDDSQSLKYGSVGAWLIQGLWMRSDGDHTRDAELKERWLDHYETHYPDDPITLVLDDRNQVVEMWRRRGYACIQVAPGDF